MINQKVGVSDNYFERESVLGGVLLCAAFSIRQFLKSLWTNSWQLSTHFQREIHRDKGGPSSIDDVDADEQQARRAA